MAEGYGSDSGPARNDLFLAMGYHLGSELLADQEFSVIDQSLREDLPDLADYLQATKVDIAGQAHVPYDWISIHSGYGGGAEADHFEWATRGVRLALELTPQKEREAALRALRSGFIRFSADHEVFFRQVRED